MTPAPEEPDEDTCAAIVGYLTEYPDAMDTFDGIADWWMARYRVRVDVERVWSAVQGLVARGILEEVGAGPRRRYRLKRDGRSGGEPR
jgi:hypothetical protein